MASKAKAASGDIVIEDEDEDANLAASGIDVLMKDEVAHFPDRSLLELSKTEPSDVLQTHISAPVKDFCTLLAQRELYRGVKVKALVAKCGQIFTKASKGIEDSDAGKEAWYAQSEALSGDRPLKGFISHLWADPGSRKGMALAMHFYNTQASILVSLLLLIALWPIACVEASSVEIIAVVFGVLVILELMYIVLVLNGHRLFFMLHKKHRFFLDICVVNQTDDVKRKSGIEHLAEFLLASKEFIICGSKKYSTRLWCVYEIATFYRRRMLLEESQSKRRNSQMSQMSQVEEEEPVGEVIMLPLWLPAIAQCVSLSTLLLLLALLAMGIHREAAPGLIVICGIALAACILVTILTLLCFRQSARQMSKGFEAFSLEKAECSSNDDKELLLDFINTTWASSLGAQDGKIEFERFVQQKLAPAFKKEFTKVKVVTNRLFKVSVMALGVEAWAFASIYAGYPVMCFGSMFENYLGDPTQKDNNNEGLPLRRRLTAKRLLIWIVMICVGFFVSAHCYGYIIEPGAIDLSMDSMGVRNDPNKNLRDEVLQPTNLNLTTNWQAFTYAVIFGLLALLYILATLRIIFLRRKVPESDKPVMQPKMGAKPADWVKYLTYATKPGRRFFWHRVLLFEISELVLQGLRLVSFAGYDLINRDPVPAATDALIILQTVVLVLDLIVIGLCFHFGNDSGAVVAETVLDIGYAICPLLSAGSLDPNLWHMLRDKSGLLALGFIATITPMSKALTSLKNLDATVFKQSMRNTKQASGRGEKETDTDQEVIPEKPSKKKRCVRIFAIFQVVGRILIGIALLVFVVVSIIGGHEDCKQMRDREGPFREWKCNWETHPLFESPRCDCRELHWDRLEGDCGLSEIPAVFDQLESVEYLIFDRYGVAGEEQGSSCLVSNDYLQSASPGAFRHIRAFEGAGNRDGLKEFPKVLREAEKIEFIQVTLAKEIQTIPTWVQELQGLKSFYVSLNGIREMPDFLDDEMPYLCKVKLDANPVCDNATLVERARTAFMQADKHCPDGKEWSCYSAQLDFEENVEAMLRDVDCEANKEAVTLFWKECSAWPAIPGEAHVCTEECRQLHGQAAMIDYQEPKGALNLMEANVLLAILGMDLFKDAEQLACNIAITGCQSASALPQGASKDALGLVWFSTIGKVMTGGQTDCTACDLGEMSFEVALRSAAIQNKSSAR